MKKIVKITAGVALAAAIATTAGVLAGCADNNPGTSGKSGSGEAYSLTHGGDYVGYAKIVYTNDKVSELTLTEVCLPTQVEAGADVAEADKVTGTVSSHGTPAQKTYYKTISYGSVTFTYDATIPEGAQFSKGYVTDGKTIGEYFATEANAKAYYEAVTSNSVKVTVGGQQKTDILNKATLSKEENGYWAREDKNGDEYSRWKMNRDATVKYVKDNGTSKLDQLVKSTTDVADLKEDKNVKPWTDGTVTTGATWSDLNSDTIGKNYLSYVQLILKADGAVK
ncbi:MAG: hypothetical protein K2N14_00990 [Clostridia bacterium]|nr:hypothetical protein [Clostridia bacterium]